MIAASVWLNHAGGRAWSCDQCTNNSTLRKQRGNCGGDFLEGLPQSQKDGAGVWVPGYRIAPDCDESFSEMRFRSCPVAGSNRLAPIIKTYYQHERGIVKINDIYPNPSCALIDAVYELGTVINTAQYRAQKRAIEEGQT